MYDANDFVSDSGALTRCGLRTAPSRALARSSGMQVAGMIRGYLARFVAQQCVELTLKRGMQSTVGAALRLLADWREVKRQLPSTRSSSRMRRPVLASFFTTQAALRAPGC